MGRIDYGYTVGLTRDVYLDLLVNNSPVTDAVVILTGSNLSSPVTVPYDKPVSYGGVGYAQYHSQDTFTYELGETYTLTCIAMGVTTSATQTAPGDISVLADGSGAVTYASWATEGNSDHVYIRHAPFITTYSLPPDQDSPVSIDPVTPYPDTGYTYNEFIDIQNQTPTVSNGSTSLGFVVGDFLQWDVNK